MLITNLNLIGFAGLYFLLFIIYWARKMPNLLRI